MVCVLTLQDAATPGRQGSPWVRGYRVPYRDICLSFSTWILTVLFGCS